MEEPLILIKEQTAQVALQIMVVVVTFEITHHQIAGEMVLLQVIVHQEVAVLQAQVVVVQ